jgi:hypothetical protein
MHTYMHVTLYMSLYAYYFRCMSLYTPLYMHTSMSMLVCIYIMHTSMHYRYMGAIPRMLTYADVCWRMLTYADVCWRMLTYADVCWRMHYRYTHVYRHTSMHYICILICMSMPLCMYAFMHTCITHTHACLTSMHEYALHKGWLVCITSMQAH